MDKIWRAKWIIDDRYYGLTPINVFHKEIDQRELVPHREDLKNQHMLVRKKFNLAGNIEKAYVDITADDYYKLYINGKFVGQGPAPGYYFHYYYNRFDITPLLNQGQNVVAVHVYYQGLINRVWNSGDYRQGLIAEVLIDNEVCAKTDKTWKYMVAKEYTSKETTGYATQYLENIDSRLKEYGWNSIHYNDQHWHHAVEKIHDDHKLVLQDTANLSVYEMSPRAVKEIAPGHFFIDMGQEITGYLKMKARGKSGQVVEIRCGEELEDEDAYKVKYNMRCNCTYKERWTLSGKEDVLEHFDYKAFRYVEVIAPEGVIDSDSFSAVVRHYPLEENRCQFYTSNKILHRIWNLCKNGVKFGTQETFVDCPSREKGQYLGDFTVTGHSHLYLSGDLRMYQKALKDFALSSYICPGLMAVAPGSLMQEIADFSLQWPQNLLLYYKHSGDLKFLEEMYPVAEHCVKYFDKYKRADGLLENVTEKWNLVDWPENLRDHYDFELTRPVKEGCHNVINAFYIGAVKALDEIRNILNIPSCDHEIQSLEEAFLKVFYNSGQKRFVDAEGSKHSALHSNIIPLYYEIAPKSAIESIVDFIKQKKFSCGVYHSYFLLKGLAKVGEYELIYQLLINDDEHSWINMLREGATTCFEAWGKEQKWNTSLCHPWASSPISVLIEEIIGLTPAKPGWGEINFCPRIPKDLGNLYFEVYVKTGKIRVEYKEGKIKIKGPDGINIVSHQREYGCRNNEHHD